MVVVLWVVGLVVHMGSGVVHVLPDATLLVVVLAAHLLMMTPLLQTCLVVVVLWMLVASLIHGSQTSVVRNLERMMVVVWLLIWGQVSSSLVDQQLEGAGAAPPPTGRPAWWGSQPVVMVECHSEPGQAQHPIEEEFAWQCLVESNHEPHPWVVVTVDHELSQAHGHVLVVVVVDHRLPQAHGHVLESTPEHPFQ